MKRLVLCTLSALLLGGCSNTIHDMKQALAGIDDKANEAATAISLVTSIRAITLPIGNEDVTINDLFKAILRDVQWQYDEANGQLTITGTWKNNGLFATHPFTEAEKKELTEQGEVTVVLSFTDRVLQSTATTAKLRLRDAVLVDIGGEEALQHLIDTYNDSKH